MTFGRFFFRNKFSHRIFFLFIVTSIIPIIILSLISIDKVSTELLKQKKIELGHENGFMTINIQERIKSINTELILLSTLLSNPSELNNRKKIIFFENLNKQLHQLHWLTNEWKSGTLIGMHDPQIHTKIRKLITNTSISNLIVTINESTAKPEVFIIIKAQTPNNNQNNNSTGHYIGKINLNYLFGAPDQDINYSHCIITKNRIILSCQQNDNTHMFITQLIKESNTANENIFEWTNKTKNYIVSYKSIDFINTRSNSPWIISSTKRMDIATEVINDFKMTFLIATLITLGFVILLTIKKIRDFLSPLDNLLKGMKNIGDIKFDYRLELEGDTEFSELANSFNIMSNKLNHQFKILSIMRKIDQLILSSENYKSTLLSPLPYIRDIMNCEFIAITIIHEDKDTDTLFINDQRTDNRVETLPIHFCPEDRKRLAGNRKGIIITREHNSKNYKSFLKRYELSSCIVTPIIVEDILSAILFYGYTETVSDTDNLSSEAKNWADRFAIAINKVKWQEKLYHEAYFDNLTKLPNRSAMKKHLLKKIENAKEKNELFGVLFIDLDRFKLINDSLGHAVGDQFLQYIAIQIKNCFSENNMVARLGGDEFTAILSNTKEKNHLQQQLTLAAKHLLKQISQPTAIHNHKLWTTASIGISTFPHDSTTMEGLMKNADSAMYYAKYQGKDTYQFYTHKMDIKIKDKLQLENDITKALANNEFELYYQPQISIVTGDIIGAEALIRWNHPKRGWVPADTFIPIAEETLLITDIDKWVFSTACKHIDQWLKEDLLNIRVSVNFSAQMFQQEKIINYVDTNLQLYQLKGDHIELEITESTLIEDISKTTYTLQALHKLGIRLAIDDFGTGYSSLSYLKKFPIHRIKIDQSFIKSLEYSSVDFTIAKTILNLAKNLNLDCIAEGVETRKQLELLKKMGCNEAQGYFFSKPLPFQQFTEKYLLQPLPVMQNQ